MPHGEDFVDPLVEEILGDAADKFFNQRRTLEYQLDLFDTYVEALKIKMRVVEKRAATLNALLLDRTTAAEFYAHLGIEEGNRLVAVGGSGSDLESLQTPLALTAGGRYRKLVTSAYARLSQGCQEYLHGPRTATTSQQEGNDEKIPAYYGLVKTMMKIINREIAKVNCNMTPSCTLQFAKNLASDLGEKQKITGSTFSEYSDLDEKMRYRALDLQSSGIEPYPELPPRQAVAKAIGHFCRKLYRKRPEEVRRILVKISKSDDDSGRV